MSREPEVISAGEKTEKEGRVIITRIMKAVGKMPDDREVMELSADIIKNGGLVAIPTETVYGLAGNALDPKASGKIYKAKGRPSDNPLIVHIADIKDLKVLSPDIPENAYKLAEKFWPGPLTMILNKSEIVPKATTGGLDTVAVRMPSNEIAREFIRACGGFIAAPSANTSGRPSCTTALHVKEDLDGRIELIIDGGDVGIGLESTIIDLTGAVPCLLRPGYISLEELISVVKNVDVDPVIAGKESRMPPKAPGMKYRHYAPRGELTIISGEREKVISYINEKTARAKKDGIKAAVLACSENRACYDSALVYDAGSIYNEEEIAHNLFSVLRRFDEEGVQLIYSEEFNTPNIGMAIMNRLIKAAGNKIIKV